jgi:transmembrane sensor
MDEPKRLAYLFRGYFEKTCTPTEKDELFALLLRAEHDEPLKRLIDESWSQEIPAYSQSDYKADQILQQILRGRQTDLPLTGAPNRAQGLGLPHYTRYAAALIAVALTSFLLYYFYHNPRLPALPAGRPLVMFPPRPARTDSFLVLSDGSRVLLHRDAHIDYQQGFANKNREVTLRGEAYFDIRSDRRPFIVHTGAITTTVLGTAFNINAYDPKTITVTVTKGKVRVENGEGEFSILRRNEQISVDSLHTRLKKTQVDAGAVLAWKKPYLLFNDVTMKEAMEEVEQRYHVTVRFTNPAAESCPVTATFTGGESLEEIIKVLSKINNMEYTIGHGTVEITGEGCK